MDMVNVSHLGEDAEAAAPPAIVLPRLPTHGGDEVADHPRSRSRDRAEIRMHAVEALLLHPTG